jgi:hypothetical protein
MQKTTPSLTIIGRSDRADLPELDIRDILVKADTGAYTSAIHAVQIAVTKKQGKKVLTFRIAGINHPGMPRKKFTFSDFSQRVITSSNGLSEYRYVIKTAIVLFGRKFRTEFSLSNRTAMRSPVLLGRRLLKGRFLVDVGQKNLSYNLKNARK